MVGAGIAVQGRLPRIRPVPGGIRGLGGAEALFVLDDVFQLVEQFLGAADAECRDQYGALITQRLLDDGFETLPTALAVFMEAVAIGAFEHEDIGAFGRLRRHQEGGVGCAQIAGKDDALAFVLLRVVQVDFYIGRAEDMARALQPDAGHQLVAVVQREPVLVRQGNEPTFDALDVAFNLCMVATDAKFECILKHDGQQLCRRLATQYRPVETRREQIRDATDMVDVNVRHDERFDGVERELDGEAIRRRATWQRGVVTLEQTAVDQYAGRGVHVQLVAGGGHAILGTMVFDDRIAHGYSFNDVTHALAAIQTRATEKIKQGFYRLSTALSYQPSFDGSMVSSLRRDDADCAPVR